MPNVTEDYLQLPYTRNVVSDRGTLGEELFLAFIEELPGCQSHGATAAEALANLEDALAEYIGSLLEDGIEPPLPVHKSEASVA